MSLPTGPCEPWPTSLCCTLPDDLDPAVVERWAMVATRILWAMSGRRWGPSCQYIVRPCKRACLDTYPFAVRWSAARAGRWVPYLGPDGLWRNAAVCRCASDCSCGELWEALLDGPVYDIVSVQVDGEVLPTEAYRVDAGALLVRTDGGCWPSCQDLAAPCGEQGTFCVTYRTGLALDEAAIAAVSDLACQLILACLPEGTKGCGTCRLPGTVTKILRQGVQIERVDPTTLFAEGRTGLTVTDAWLAAVNPYNQSEPSRVYSPDYRRPRTAIWP